MSKTNEEIIMENIKTIEEWALQGMSQKEMAEVLGMGYSTFRMIKSKNLALSALLKQCANTRKKQEEEDIKSVEKSLLDRARGYDVKELSPVKIKKEFINGDGKKYMQEEVVQVETTRHIPADMQAARFYLLNKDKKTWKDNPHKVEHDKKLLELKEKEAQKDDWNVI